MEYKELLAFIEKLGIEEREEIYTDGKDKLIIYRPEKLGRSLKNKNYDVKKNFQIILKKPNEEEFLPNHLRVMISVDRKFKHGGEGAEKFFSFIESIYKGEDPEKFKDELSRLDLPEELDSSFITLCLIQLFMSEQDINYTHGKVQPPRSFLMGYLRFIKTQQQNIDKILWSSTRHPPRKEFRED